MKIPSILAVLFVLSTAQGLAAPAVSGRERVLSGSLLVSTASQKTTFTEFSGLTTTRTEEQSPRSYSAGMAVAYRRNWGSFELGPSISLTLSSFSAVIGAGVEGDYNLIPNRPGQPWVPGARLSLGVNRADTKWDEASAALRWSGAGRVFLKAYPGSGPIFLESSLGLVLSTSSSEYTIPGVFGQATVSTAQLELASAIGYTF